MRWSAVDIEDLLENDHFLWSAKAAASAAAAAAAAAAETLRPRPSPLATPQVPANSLKRNASRSPDIPGAEAPLSSRSSSTAAMSGDLGVGESCKRPSP